MIKKKIIWVAAAAAVCAVLAVVAIYLNSNFTPQTSDPVDPDMDVTTNYEREGTLIYSVGEHILDSVTVQNEHGEFTLYRDDNGQVRIRGYENVPILTYGPEALYTCAVELRVESTIEMNSAHLEYYGLDEPQAVMTVGKSTGSDVFYLGDKTPDGGGYYFRNAADSNVYVVSTYFAERLLRDKSEYYSKDIYVVYDYENDGFNTLLIDYPDRDDDVYARFCTQEEIDSKKYESAILLEKPFLFGANSSNVRACVESMLGVTANEVITDDITPELLTQYGLDNPVKVEVNFNVNVSLPVINNEENTLYDPTATEGQTEAHTSTYYIGAYNKDTDEYYVMYNDANVIYTVDASVFGFVENTTDYFCQYLLAIVYLSDVSSITLETGGESYTIETYTESIGGVTEYHGTYQSIPLEGQNIQNMYRYIVSIVQMGYAQKPENTEPYLRITLELNDGSSTVLEFYPLNSDNLYYFASVNGDGVFKVYYRELDIIVNNIQKLISGQTVEYIN